MRVLGPVGTLAPVCGGSVPTRRVLRGSHTSKRRARGRSWSQDHFWGQALAAAGLVHLSPCPTPGVGEPQEDPEQLRGAVTPAPEPETASLWL